ncbi:MAG: four helix bundle protein, partial [Candidatus Gracilibacteria bacterium]|nr:four helix bundle protein [Candidatus Gracilibacteria bacterium]
SNIAEGYGRNGKQEYKQFLGIAKGSSFELETQLLISKELGFINDEKFNELNNLNSEIIKILTTIINKI